MNKLTCELTNWDRFLRWLEKINSRTLKTPKLNTTEGDSNYKSERRMKNGKNI